MKRKPREPKMLTLVNITLALTGSLDASLVPVGTRFALDTRFARVNPRKSVVPTLRSPCGARFASILKFYLRWPRGRLGYAFLSWWTSRLLLQDRDEHRVHLTRHLGVYYDHFGGNTSSLLGKYQRRFVKIEHLAKARGIYTTGFTVCVRKLA